MKAPAGQPAYTLVSRTGRRIAVHGVNWQRSAANLLTAKATTPIVKRTHAQMFSQK